MRFLKATFSLLKDAAFAWHRDKGPLLAASIAYYTVFSLAPLLVISVAVAGFVFGEAAVEGQLVGQIEIVVGREIATTIERIIENAAMVNASGVLATVASVALLFVGASGVFGQLKTALNMMWGISPAPESGWVSAIRTRFLAFSMVLGIGFLLLMIVAMNVILAGLRRYLAGISPELVAGLPRLDMLIALLVITVLFAIVYRVLPDADVTWQDVWLGATVTALLFALGEYLIGLYLAHSSVGSAYGAAGSLVVILAWIYYSAMILLYGAEFTQLYANRYGSKIRPAQNARLVGVVSQVRRLPQSDPPHDLSSVLWRIYRRPDRPAAWLKGGNLPWDDPDFSVRMLREHLDESHGAASRVKAERQQQIDWMEHQLGLKPGNHILDVTCGPGLYACELARRGYQVTGVDFSPASITYAREVAREMKLTDLCHFQQQDVRQMQLAEAQFDAALFIYGQLAVFTRDEAQDLLKKIAKALKPGGRLCVELLNQERVNKQASNWWYTDDQGLWGSAPFLHLGERLWYEEDALSLERFYIVHLDDGELQEITLCDQTYAASEMEQMMKAAGFSQVRLFPAWNGLSLYDAEEWIVYVAER